MGFIPKEYYSNHNMGIHGPSFFGEVVHGCAVYSEAIKVRSHTQFTVSSGYSGHLQTPDLQTKKTAQTKPYQLMLHGSTWCIVGVYRIFNHHLHIYPSKPPLG